MWLQKVEVVSIFWQFLHLGFLQGSDVGLDELSYVYFV